MTEACRPEEFLARKVRELQKIEDLSLRDDVVVIAVNHEPIFNDNAPAKEIELFHGVRNGSGFQFEQIDRATLSALRDNRPYDPWRSISHKTPGGITVYNIFS